MHPHRRHNPLDGSWVIVSPQRTQRPWQGRSAERPPRAPAYDPTCPLCPGNRRGGEVNPNYTSTYSFVNDFPALVPDVAVPATSDDPLFVLDAASGECRVLCWSPRHDASLADLAPSEMAAVVDRWCAEHAELGERYEWVQLFETRGVISGASNPHPHGQVWASSFVPHLVATEAERQARYHGVHGTALLVDYLDRELALDERVVVANEHWVVVVPYWAYWPYETLVLPRRPVGSLVELDSAERESLATVVSTMLAAFDRVFDTPFPYCSGWHGAPRSAPSGSWQLHAHYYPPLLRAADVAKIPASYEMLAEVQRDLTPEAAARTLRDLI